VAGEVEETTDLLGRKILDGEKIVRGHFLVTLLGGGFLLNSFASKSVKWG
jgi:hypothetical protein